MIGHLAVQVTLCQKLGDQKKVGFAPQKRSLVADLQLLLVKEAYLLVQHVGNGVCRKTIIVKKFIVVRVALLPNIYRKSNMLQSLRYYCRSDEEPHRMPWVSRVMGDLSGF